MKNSKFCGIHCTVQTHGVWGQPFGEVHGPDVAAPQSPVLLKRKQWWSKFAANKKAAGAGSSTDHVQVSDSEETPGHPSGANPLMAVEPEPHAIPEELPASPEAAPAQPGQHGPLDIPEELPASPEVAPAQPGQPEPLAIPEELPASPEAAPAQPGQPEPHAIPEELPASPEAAPAQPGQVGNSGSSTARVKAWRDAKKAEKEAEKAAKAMEVMAALVQEHGQEKADQIIAKRAAAAIRQRSHRAKAKGEPQAAGEDAD